jgi:hypothetical protein
VIDRVSDIFGFVLEHGPLADEILFSEPPLPGLTEAEREAIAKVQRHLEQSWIGLLSACREALWAVAAGHPCAEAMQQQRVRPLAMYERRSFHVWLVSGQALCCAGLDSWGRPHHHVRVWVWTRANHHPLAERAVAGLELPVWRNENRSFVLDLDTPKAGERFADIGQQTAEALWTFARPIAEAVRADGW